MTITFNPDTFRVQFPQFADLYAYPDVTLQGNFDLGTSYVSADTFGSMTVAARTYALNLMTAHLLALGTIIATGGTPGNVIGSRVGDVQVQLQPPPARSQWAWWLNTTPYGAQLVALLDMQSAGGFFVGGLPERAAFRKVGGVFF
jgi:hypothetical protein